MMNKLRESFLAKTLMLLGISIALTLPSCTSTEETAANPQELNGEQLFAGIYFGFGPYAENLSIYNEQRRKTDQLTEEDKAEVSKRINQLTAAINASDPVFFDNFQQAVTSGNHLTIRGAVKEGAIKFYENMDAIFPEMKAVISQIDEDAKAGVLTDKEGKVDYSKLEAKAGEYENLLKNNMISSGSDERVMAPCSWAVACVFYAAVAAHNTIAATANLAVVGAAAIYLAVTFWGPGIDEEEAGRTQSLSTDILINDIASSF